MKFLLALALALALALGAFTVQCDRKPVPAVQPLVVSIQQKATHMITFMKYGEGAGICTGTAIGPHAILTAHHCNKDGDVDTIKLDNAFQEEMHIEKVLTDGRDHDIYLLDGPAFTNIAFYKSRPTKVGEKVYLYGDGGGNYPPRRLEGNEVTLFTDYSDVDARNHQIMFTMKPIPGDSGSAVWSEDGNIVAVTTYLWLSAPSGGTVLGAVDFEPGFTEDQITEEETFAPSPYVKKSEVKPVRSPFTFPLFN